MIDSGLIGGREEDTWGDGELADGFTGFTQQEIDQVGHGGDALAVGVLGDGSLQVTADDHAGDLVGAVVAEDSHFAGQCQPA